MSYESLKYATIFVGILVANADSQLCSTVIKTLQRISEIQSQYLTHCMINHWGNDSVILGNYFQTCRSSIAHNIPSYSVCKKACQLHEPCKAFKFLTTNQCALCSMDLYIGSELEFDDNTEIDLQSFLVFLNPLKRKDNSIIVCFKIA